jgi:hypothetical protein
MMVVRWNDSEVLLVLQIDHSRIAGLLAAHWGNARFAEPTPYASMVVAAQEHDSGWWDWEIKPTIASDGSLLDYIDTDWWDWDGSFRAAKADPSVDAGNPADISESWFDFYRTIVDRVRREDEYASWIISKHGVGLVTQGFGLLSRLPDGSASPRVRAFAEEQERLREDILAGLRSSPEFREHAGEEQLWTNYKLMEVYDQFAQYICNRYPLNDARPRRGPRNVIGNVPLAPGKADVELRIEPVDERTAIVTPYPFDVDPLPISFSGRLVTNRRFASQDEFLRDYYRAPRVAVDYLLRA